MKFLKKLPRISLKPRATPGGPPETTRKSRGSPDDPEEPPRQPQRPRESPEVPEEARIWPPMLYLSRPDQHICHSVPIHHEEAPMIMRRPR